MSGEPPSPPNPVKNLLAEMAKRPPGTNPMDFLSDIMESEAGQALMDREEKIEEGNDEVRSALRYLRGQLDRIEQKVNLIASQVSSR